MKATRRTSRGFTLLELLIALSVLALLVTLLYSGLRTGITTWDHTNEISQAVEDQRLVQNFLRASFQQAIPTNIESDGSVGSYFRGGGSEVEFPGVLPLHRAVGGVYILRFRTVGAGNSRRLLFDYRLLRDLNSPGGEWQRSKVLLDHISDLRIAYFGVPRKGMPPAWQNSWTGAERFPDLVRVYYKITGDQGINLFFPLGAKQYAP